MHVNALTELVELVELCRWLVSLIVVIKLSDVMGRAIGPLGKMFLSVVTCFDCFVRLKDTHREPV